MSYGIDEALLQRLPLPLALLARRTRNAKTDLERHLTAFYLWEASLKLLGSVAIVEYAEAGRRDPAIDERLKTLARPSVGHWWEYVRRIVPLLAREDDAFGRVQGLLFGPPRHDMPMAAGLEAFLAEGEPGSGSARATVRLSGPVRPPWCSTATARSATARSAGRSNEQHARMSRALLQGVGQVLEKLDVPAGRRLVYVGDVRRHSTGDWLVERYELIGESARKLELLQAPESQASRLPRPERVYLESSLPTRDDSQPRFRSIHPLLCYQPEVGRTYLLNSRKGKGSVEYVCYDGGDPLSKPLDADHRELMATVLGTPVGIAAADSWAAWSRVDARDENEPAAAEDDASTRRIGEYELLSRLGRGGMGVVYRAWQPSLAREVALKCLLRPGDPKAEARFAREIRALARVDHPNLVRIFSAGTFADQWFYVMELVEGAELSLVCEQLAGKRAAEVDEASWRLALDLARTQTLGREEMISDTVAPLRASAGKEAVPVVAPSAPRAAAGGRSYVRMVVNTMIPVSRAAQALHEAGIVHRDIKPGNIMIAAEGSTPVLMDLGLAQLADEAEGRLTRTRQFVGTLRYASPEQVLAVADVDRRADVYSLGATLWELLTLRPIYGADGGMPDALLMQTIQHTDPEPASRHNPNVPRDLQAILSKCLEKNPGRRYSTAAELADDLGRFLRNEPVLAQPPSAGYLAGKFVRRYRAPLATAAAVLALLVAGTVAAFVRINQENRRVVAANDQLKAERDRADRARDLAVKNQELAERRFDEKRTSLDQMLAQFSERGLVGTVGAQEIRSSLLEKGISLYQQILRDRADDPATRASLAGRYLELGSLRREIATAEEALAPLKEALALQRAVVAADLKDPAKNARLADILYQNGECLWEHRRAEEAVAPVKESLAIATDLAARFPDDPNYQVAVARATTRLASVVEQKDGGDALYSKSREILAPVVQKDPKNATALVELARAENNQCVTRIDRNDAPGALKLAGEAVKHGRAVLEIEPTNPLASRLIGFALGNSARVLEGTGRRDEARKLLLEAIEDSKSFVARNPAVLRGQYALAYIYDRLGALETNARRPDQAVEAFDAAARLYEGLAQRDPGDERYVTDRFTDLIRILDNELPRGRNAAAAAAMDRALSNAAEVMARHPKSHMVLAYVMRCYRLRAEIDASTSPQRTSPQFELAAIDFFEKHRAANDPKVSYDPISDLALCAGTAAALFSERKDWASATRLADRILPILNAGPIDEPTVREQRVVLLANLAPCYERAGRNDDAIAVWRQVREAAQASASAPGGRFQANNRTYIADTNLARLYGAAGRTAEQVEAAREALKAYAYLEGRDYTKLLADSAEPTMQNARGLSAVLAGTQTHFFVYHIKANVNGAPRTIPIYVGDSPEAVEDQVRYLESSGSIKLDPTQRDGLKKIAEIAQKNKVSYRDLIRYSTGSGGLQTPAQARLMKRIGVLKGSHETATDRETVRRHIVEAYLTLASASAELSMNVVPEAVSALADALRFLDRDDAGAPRDTRARELYARIKTLEGTQEARAGRPDRAYAAFVDGMKYEEGPPDSPAEYRRRAARFGSLGRACEKQDRFVEAACWYARAAILGHGDGVRDLAELYLRDETIRFALPPEFASALERAAEQARGGDLAKDFPDKLSDVLRKERFASLARDLGSDPLRHARTLRDQGDPREGASVLKKALEAHAEDPAILTELGICLREASDEVGARDAFRRAGQADPGGDKTPLAALYHLETQLVSGPAGDFLRAARALEGRSWKADGRDYTPVFRTLLALGAAAAGEKAVPPTELGPVARRWDWAPVIDWLKTGGLPEDRKAAARAALEAAAGPQVEFAPAGLLEYLDSDANATEFADMLCTIVVLCRGKDMYNRNFWAYMLIKPSKAKAFRQARERGAMNLGDFGTIVEAGEGNDPPADVKKKMAEKHGVQDDLEEKLLKEIREDVNREKTK
ncbi:MAG: DUF2610 domain-containing protein [Isosphaeraceae bacterium]